MRAWSYAGMAQVAGVAQPTDVRGNFLFFKPVPGGYVFRAPTPWIFFGAQHYLVSETQRDEITAILLPTRQGRALAKTIGISLGLVVAITAAIIGITYVFSEHIDGFWLAAGSAVTTFLLLFGWLHVVARRNLRRLRPILAAAQRTEHRITNAEMREAVRDKTSLKQSWLTAAAFGVISLFFLASLVFERNQKLPFFSDGHSFWPTFQLLLFAYLAATGLQTTLKKINRQEPLSPGPASVLARPSRQLVLGLGLAMLGVAIVIASVGVRRKFSDYTQGLRHEAKGEHDSAIASFSRAIKSYPGDPAAYASRAEIYRAKGEHDLTIADLSRLIELRPEGADAYISRGRSFEAKGDRVHAIADFGKAIGIEPKRAFAYYWRSRSREATGDREGAIADLGAALEINPKDTASYIARARIFEAKGEPERAMADFATAISLDPRHSFAHFWRGLSLAARGDHAGAIADFTKALEFHPKDHHIHSSRGRSYDAKGEVGLAIADFTKAIEYKPDYAFAYRQRASAYANKGDRDNAIADFTRVIELTPKDVFAYVSRGVIFAARNEHDRAIADLTKALELDPRNKSVYSSRAASYAATGARDLAISDYQAVLGLPAATAADRQWQDQARGRIARLKETSPSEPTAK